MHILPLTAKDVEERLRKIPSLDAFYSSCILDSTGHIVLSVDYTIKDGSEIKFRSPAEYSMIAGLVVHYPDMSNNPVSQEFTFVDAHGNDVGVLEYLFAKNAVVKVILDINSNKAFVQNADTNVYIESRFTDLLITEDDIDEICGNTTLNQ